LSGLYTSLFASQHPFVAPVACDMPFINPVLLQTEMDLLNTSGADIVIPESANGLEPLHAVYRREVCLPIVYEAIIHEQRRLIGWFEKVNVRIMTLNEVAVYDLDHRAFINVNTPEDFASAESLTRVED
jgi:molybdopterin-guanine dinucleotide biosynthesis protein A